MQKYIILNANLLCEIFKKALLSVRIFLFIQKLILRRNL